MISTVAFQAERLIYFKRSTEITKRCLGTKNFDFLGEGQTLLVNKLKYIAYLSTIKNIELQTRRRRNALVGFV